ncbi:MAG TPA: hypothetical protein VGR08_11850, partial [Thermomicrobiales bacterium]|nr:hypothetical protein [Thermomicrobiales bacterium]
MNVGQISRFVLGHKALVAGFWLVAVIASIALAAYIYFFVRGLIETRVSDAMDNAWSLVSLERRLGLFHEATIQRWLLDRDWLVTVANAIYIYGHW